MMLIVPEANVEWNVVTIYIYYLAPDHDTVLTRPVDVRLDTAVTCLPITPADMIFTSTRHPYNPINLLSAIMYDFAGLI